MKQTLQQFLQNSLAGQTIKVCCWLGNFDGPYQRKWLKKGEVALIKSYEPNQSLTDIFTPQWVEKQIRHVGIYPNDEQLLLTFTDNWAMTVNLTDDIEFIQNEPISRADN